ncbi:MAG: aminotransferase class III-fold pyridoxal phosphate-dependent enzyme, partial [Haliea sp.]
MHNSIEMYLLLIPAVLVFAYLLWIRLRLSLAKHPSLRGHAKWSRRMARLVPYYSFGPECFFSSDGAPPEVADQRRAGIDRLLRQLHARSPRSIEFGATLEDRISDVNFTSAYRVPFPYREGLAKALRQGSIVDRSEGVRLRDIDGNWRYDLSGSYGVNVFGYDFYKDCLTEAERIAGPLGPVLGPYHPVIRDNVERLQAISGLDEVSFHMSGTEAVMQAVRLARYHTGRSHLVRLCGAYHGWWD